MASDIASITGKKKARELACSHFFQIGEFEKLDLTSCIASRPAPTEEGRAQSYEFYFPDPVGKVISQPYREGDLGELAYFALQALRFDGRPNDLPSLHPRPSTSYLFDAASLEAAAGTTFESLPNQAGADFLVGDPAMFQPDGFGGIPHLHFAPNDFHVSSAPVIPESGDFVMALAFYLGEQFPYYALNQGGSTDNMVMVGTSGSGSISVQYNALAVAYGSRVSEEAPYAVWLQRTGGQMIGRVVGPGVNTEDTSAADVVAQAPMQFGSPNPRSSSNPGDLYAHYMRIEVDPPEDYGDELREAFFDAYPLGS